MGIMEKKMEATIMENQIEKKMENEMETGIINSIYERLIESLEAGFKKRIGQTSSGLRV